MKDRQIGDIFNFPNMGRLKVVESAMSNDCNGCVFQRDTNPYCGNDINMRHTGYCSFDARADHKDVIFVKAKEDEQ